MSTEECSICLEIIPVCYMVGTMCLKCSHAHKERTHAEGKKLVDPAKQTELPQCPWCQEPIGAVNVTFHFNKCANCPKEIAEALKDCSFFQQFTWLKVGSWYQVITQKLVTAGINASSVPMP